MALELPNSIFLHIPKTGGSWVRKAIEAAGIETSERDWAHSRVGTKDAGGKFRFAFVRHPIEWYQSRWMYRMERGWRDHRIDNNCIACDFKSFVEKMIVYNPGYLASMYVMYCGSRNDEINFIGRQERLADDLITALKLAGESFDESAIRSMDRVNACEYRYNCDYSDDLKAALLKSETKAIERFYPEVVIP